MKAYGAILALAGALIVGGCEGTSPQSSLGAACQGYASVLASLAHVKDELSDAEIATVDTIRASVNPICSDLDGVTDYRDALVTVRNAVRKLNEVQS